MQCKTWWCVSPRSSDRSTILLSCVVCPSDDTSLVVMVTDAESRSNSQLSSRTNRWFRRRPPVPPSSKAADVLWNNGSTCYNGGIEQKTSGIVWENTDILWCHHWLLCEMSSTERLQWIHTDDLSLPRSGKCFWLVEANFPHGNHTHPDLGSNTSSVWKLIFLCSFLVDVITIEY